MSEPIVQLTLDDYDEAIDFLNLVFSVHGPIDFERLLPKLYRPTAERIGRNYAIRRNGRIRAIVGLFPMELVVGDVTLSVAGIGGVSAHPKDRGAGHMRRLMNHCVQVMREEHYDISWLGGQRQRYGYFGYFGYEIAGTALEFEVSRTNVRHAYGSISPLEFREIDRDSDLLERIVGMHDSRIIRAVRRREQFVEIAASWGQRLFAALESGRPTGYIVADPKRGSVHEIAADPGHEAAIVSAWVEHQQLENVRFELPALPSPLLDEMARVCERSVVRSCGNWQIFDWERVVGTFLAIRHAARPLVPGTLRLGIAGYGTLELTVDADAAGCARTKSAPDLTLEPAAAIRALFGPLPPWAQGTATSTLLDAWCPLPLFMPHQDEV